MSATFKCLSTGNLVTFKYPVDIDSMRIHPEYEEVVIEEPAYTETVIEPVLKRHGRPKKAIQDIDTDSI